MKKKIMFVISLLFIGILIFLYLNNRPIKEVKKSDTKKQNEIIDKKEIIEKNSYVSYNGKLSVNGTDIVNKYNEKIQLKGISSHGIQWYGNLITNENIKILHDMGSNVFRIAMYTNEGGYLFNHSLEDKVNEYVDLVIKNDMYIIIDWHILSDNDPMQYLNESKQFFERMAKKYKDTPNVIFEICNEPNGNVNWNNNIKPYAEEVIKVIRKYNNNIIIVGTSTWSQDVDEAANSPLDYENIVYACHFYSGSHTEWLREKIKYANDKGICVFVSEWGTSSADGNGGVFKEESDKWINFLDEKNISWVNWSLSNKQESSALLKPNTDIISDENLSESGKYVIEQIKK